MGQCQGEGVWNLNFIRPLNDWDVNDSQHFLCLLNSKRVKHEEKDRLFWKGDKKGVYTIRANAALLEGDNGRTTPLNVLWNNYVPPKVCFAWEEYGGEKCLLRRILKRGVLN